MRTVTLFEITLSDNNSTLKLSTNRVEWLEGGDSKVQFRAYVGVSQGQLLDKWESSQSLLEVSIVPVECGEVDESGQVISSDCDEDLVDYNSQSGKAKVSWVYNPTGPSKILLEFEGGEQ